MQSGEDASLDERMQDAIHVLTHLILQRFPGTTFDIQPGDHSSATFVTAVVDLDDPDDAVDCFIDRLLDLQVDEGIRLHIVPVRSPARRDAMLAQLATARTSLSS